MKAKARKKGIAPNHALINALAPIAIKFDKDSISLDETEAVGMAATRFPAKADFEWLTEPCNLSNTITTITFTPETSPDIILKEIGNTVSSNKLTAEGAVSADPVERIRAQKVVEDGSKIIEQIANNNEGIGQMSLLTMALGKNPGDVRLKAQAAKSKYAGRMFTLRALPFMQKDLYEALSPCGQSPGLLSGVTNQLMPMSTMLGGFPFAFAGYNDGEGAYFGKDSAGGLIVVDLWKRGLDRTNSNMVCMGVSGAGKSTALKHLILNEWETGTKIVVIDPHGEYKEICENLGGDWIDAVGGAGGRINPLHIYPKAAEFDEDGNEIKLPELARQINNLEVFFRLYLDLTPSMVAVLKESLELTYFAKGITWESDVSKLRPEQFPVMSELYAAVEARAKEADDSLKRSETNYYKELALLLRGIAMGADSFIWNGPSTVNVKKDFVVFDTSAVNSTANNIRTTLYHTVLNYCEGYLYRDKHERVLLVADEAHNIIDKRLPATIARLANIEKSCRKFESGIWICSQQLIDFLDEAIRKEGQALLDQPNIKLLMPVGKGRDLKELRELYDLTEAEEERLMQQQRGKGLIFIGSRHLAIDFDIPPHRFDEMGTGGGR